MQVTGRIIAAMPLKKGQGARGEWQAQEFVLETPGLYPKKLVFSVFGAERLQRFNIQIGQELEVFFDIDAHEFNGRWYNEVRSYDVRPAGMQPQQPAPQYAQPQPPTPQQGDSKFPF